MKKIVHTLAQSSKSKKKDLFSLKRVKNTGKIAETTFFRGKNWLSSYEMNTFISNLIQHIQEPNKLLIDGIYLHYGYHIFIYSFVFGSWRGKNSFSWRLANQFFSTKIPISMSTFFDTSAGQALAYVGEEGCISC